MLQMHTSPSYKVGSVQVSPSFPQFLSDEEPCLYQQALAGLFECLRFHCVTGWDHAREQATVYAELQVDRYFTGEHTKVETVQTQGGRALDSVLH